MAIKTQKFIYLTQKIKESVFVTSLTVGSLLALNATSELVGVMDHGVSQTLKDYKASKLYIRPEHSSSEVFDRVGKLLTSSAYLIPESGKVRGLFHSIKHPKKISQTGVEIEDSDKNERSVNSYHRYDAMLWMSKCYKFPSDNQSCSIVINDLNSTPSIMEIKTNGVKTVNFSVNSPNWYVYKASTGVSVSPKSVSINVLNEKEPDAFKNYAGYLELKNKNTNEGKIVQYSIEYHGQNPQSYGSYFFWLTFLASGIYSFFAPSRNKLNLYLASMDRDLMTKVINSDKAEDEMLLDFFTAARHVYSNFVPDEVMKKLDKKYLAAMISDYSSASTQDKAQVSAKIVAKWIGRVEKYYKLGLIKDKTEYFSQDIYSEPKGSYFNYLVQYFVSNQSDPRESVAPLVQAYLSHCMMHLPWGVYQETFKAAGVSRYANELFESIQDHNVRSSLYMCFPECIKHLSQENKVDLLSSMNVGQLDLLKVTSNNIEGVDIAQEIDAIKSKHLISQILPAKSVHQGVQKVRKI